MQDVIHTESEEVICSGCNSHGVSFVKDRSSYRYYRLVTVKIKLGVINSFRPLYVSSLFPLLSLFSGEEKLHFYFSCNPKRAWKLHALSHIPCLMHPCYLTIPELYPFILNW